MTEAPDIFRSRVYLIAMLAPTDTPTSHLTLQFLAWLEEAPRTYSETMNAWRTSCPRLSIWEDALGDRLVRIEPGPSMRERRVAVTDAGKGLLRMSGLKQNV
jgi:hypothetical protein